MSYQTLEQTTQDVIGLLSQATGVGVQVYAQPRIELLVNKTFELLYNRQWWPGYMRWFQGALDGTNGIITTDISDIKRYEDVRAVFQSGSDTPLPQLSDECNPYDLPSGQTLFIDSYEATDPEKVFRVWSATATGTIAVHARIMPDTFVSSDEIRFDSLALVYGAAWAYAEDDGTNPGATQKFQTLFENRVKDIECEVQHKPIALDGRTVKIPSQWYVR
jgi:hypothetical protein